MAAVDCLNVKESPGFAVGDGVADDRAAIQAAIDGLPARGGVVFFPSARYKCAGSLTIPPDSVKRRVTLLGSGRGN